MAFADSLPTVFDTLLDVAARRFKIILITAVILLMAAIGTWIAGQYQIGKLDDVSRKYNEPVQDFALTQSKAKPESVERDVLDACKQSQIGTWLQTTDALNFKDPISGNRVLVQLDPERGFVDLNGREMGVCVRDEIENRQFDISEMTNNWALLLAIIAFGIGGFGYAGYRKNNPTLYPKIMDVDAEPVSNDETVANVTSEFPISVDPKSESQ